MHPEPAMYPVILCSKSNYVYSGCRESPSSLGTHGAGEKGFDPKRSQHSTFDGASDHGPGDMNAVRRLSQFLSANQADNKPGPKSSYPTSLTGITPGVHHNNNLPTTFPKLTGISQNGEHRGGNFCSPCVLYSMLHDGHSSNKNYSGSSHC